MNNDITIEPRQVETVERYLNNSMNDVERKEFDRKLEEDSQFKKEFEDTKALILGIELAALKNELEFYHKEIDIENKSKIIKKKNLVNRWSEIKFLPYAMAASILLVLGLFIFMDNTPSNQELFAKHFVPDAGLPAKMGSNNNFDFYDAMVDYKRAEYATAIEKWLKLQKNDSQNDTLNYFIGVAFLAQGNELSAQKYLVEAAKNSKGAFENETYYYLGLAYLKSNNPEEARRNFQKSKIEDSKRILSEISK